VTGWAADGRRRVNSLMPRLRDLAGVMLGQLRSASVVAAVQNGVQCTASFPNPRFFGFLGQETPTEFVFDRKYELCSMRHIWAFSRSSAQGCNVNERS